MIFTTAGTEREESICHSHLLYNGQRYQGEWFKVPKEFFDRCLKYGFIDFPLKNKNQNIYPKNSTAYFNNQDFIEKNKRRKEW
jgi:hypothetical protein